MPPPRRQPEAGTRSEFKFRYGPEVPMLGHRRRGDPGSIRLPNFEFLQNVRFGDGIGGRPGSKVFINGLGGILTSLYDFQITGANSKLYIIYNGVPKCTLPFGFIGFSVNWLDFETASTFQRGTAYPATDSLCMAVFDGNLYLGNDAVLKRFITINPDYNDESVFVSGFEQSEILKTFTGFKIRCLNSAFGKLFIGLDNGAGASKIVSYDGVTFKDDDVGIDPPKSMALFRNDLLVVGISTTGLRVRQSSGVWTAYAGAVAPNKMISYRDLLYMVSDTATGATSIWTFDGAAVVNAHTIANTRIAGLAVRKNVLYFGYGTTITLKAIIGTLDAAGVYTDVYKNITAQSAADDFALAQRVGQLSIYRDGIVAGVNNDNALLPYGGRLMFGEGTALAGAWTALTPYTPTDINFQTIVAFDSF